MIWELEKKYKLIIKNTIPKTMPKDFSEPLFIEMWPLIFIIFIWDEIYYFSAKNDTIINQQKEFMERSVARCVKNC